MTMLFLYETTLVLFFHSCAKGAGNRLLMDANPLASDFSRAFAPDAANKLLLSDRKWIVH